MILSIIDRLEIVRKRAGLNKSQFERSLSVSTGYLKLTEKRQSQPGTELLIEFSKVYSDICLEWLLTGEGEMVKNIEDKESLEFLEQDAEIQKIRIDLKALSEGITKNFEVLSEAMMQSLLMQRKVLGFTDKLDAGDIIKATSHLEEILNKEKK